MRTSNPRPNQRFRRTLAVSVLTAASLGAASSVVASGDPHDGVEHHVAHDDIDHEPPVDTTGPVETGAADHHPTRDAAGWIKVGDERATYRDRRSPTTYSIFDPFRNPRPGWGATRIGFFVECDSVGFDQIDPIVNPGARRSHHLHEFFGNPRVTEDTTTQQLADTPQSAITCSDRNDKSAYWSPAVYQDGRRVTSTGFKAYYKSTTTDAVPMPLGLRMVAGDMAARKNQSEQIGGWVGDGNFNRVNTFGADEMMGRPRPGVEIALRINFPNCWDGVHLDSPDHRSHMAYFDEASQRCPPTHPVKVPQVTTFTHYDVDGGRGLTLASGEWYTFHQDFWNAWSPDQQGALTEECIEARMMCRVRTTPALVALGQHTVTIPPGS